jgi:hypothetical protein
LPLADTDRARQMADLVSPSFDLKGMEERWRGPMAGARSRLRAWTLSGFPRFDIERPIGLGLRMV